MRVIVLLFLAILSACGTPPAQKQVALVASEIEAEAMELVWVFSYGMEKESAPVVEWFAEDCTNVDGDITAPPGFCYGGSAGVDNNIVDVRWTGSVASSAFTDVLLDYRHILMTGDLFRGPVPPDEEEMRLTAERLI